MPDIRLAICLLFPRNSQRTGRFPDYAFRRDHVRMDTEYAPYRNLLARKIIIERFLRIFLTLARKMPGAQRHMM